MVLASLDVWHSRPIVPTRRVAVGAFELPVDPAPGFGGLLLGAIAARFADAVDDDLRSDMSRLLGQVERGLSVGQPRLRFRFQKDRIGLSRSRHRLLSESTGLRFEFATKNVAPIPSALGAVYVAAQMSPVERTEVIAVLRRGLEWRGPLEAGLTDHLLGAGSASRLWSAGGVVFSEPVAWALDILGYTADEEAKPRDVQKRYRRLLREAHPDHGGGDENAAVRIAELSRAREILLR